ncbi:CHAD domain-containing protein [Streptomyces sp. SF28]|nr:CHAD domain-containing protein [Streptomyces pinistramenti]
MTRGGAGVAQRPDLPAGGPTGLIGIGIGNGYEPGSGHGYGPGGAPGARAAVVDGPGGPQDAGGRQETVGLLGSGGLQGAGGPYGSGGPGPYGARGPQECGGPLAPGDALPAHATAGDVLAAYLHRQSADFLRSLRLHRESGSDAEGAEAAARQLRAAARRISATLYTFRPLTEETWADQLRAELGWLSATLAREHACARRRDRLMAALQRLTGRPERGPRTTAPERTGRTRSTERSDRMGGAGRAERAGSTGHGERAIGAFAPGVPASALPASAGRSTSPPPASAGTAQAADPDAESVLSAGAARAAALLDRQLTLARTRAHSAALQALGSARFHALADAVAVLASEAPLDRAAAAGPAAETLHPLADHAHHQLSEAVAALPLARAGHPYPADALGAEHRQDTPWHQVRALVRLSRYAQEIVAPDRTDPRLAEAGRALERHRDASEAATAAASAARTPRIAPATAYALGVLHADQRHDVEAARFTFGRLWLPAPAPESRWS